MSWKFWQCEHKEYNITDAYVKHLGPSSDLAVQGILLVGWSAEGIGFGELAFYKRGDKFYCETECMGKAFVKAVIDKLLSKSTTYLEL